MNPALAPNLARRYDLDWLRTAAVLMLIPYHASRLFDVWEPYYVKNSPTSSALTMLRAFVDPWGMPLLFVIAGAGAFFALQRRTGVQFLRERILRLIIPLVFGLLILVPPQAYFAWLGQGHQASYWKFLQQYWTFNSRGDNGLERRFHRWSSLVHRLAFRHLSGNPTSLPVPPPGAREAAYPAFGDYYSATSRHLRSGNSVMDDRSSSWAAGRKPQPIFLSLPLLLPGSCSLQTHVSRLAWTGPGAGRLGWAL